MIRDNPLLGPEWDALAEAIVLVLNETGKNRTFLITTYGLRFGLDPDTSPYFQGFKDEFGEFFIEASANLNCEPLLTGEEFAMMDFLSWDQPALSPEEFRKREFSVEANDRPNFERRFSSEVSRVDIAEFVMQTMVLVYGLTEEDFYNFGDRETSEKVEALGKLGRLKKTDGNPDRQIFAMPGKHIDLL
jgi:hypothetical protein